jgi:activator of Hsp90 ATPase-like protein
MKLIEKSIRINAAPEKVWSVFTDPAVSGKIGGSYNTDWKPGSFFGWRSQSGIQITYGKLLEYRQGSYLKHALFKGEDENDLSSVISYSTVGENDHTILFATEELAQLVTEAEFADVNIGWDAALNAVKDLAESL